jgi:dolichyl-phosphate-mannose-protein mannosyltransferase
MVNQRRANKIGLFISFDEVHFGKFLGHYLQRAYFFDVHPPLAKLTLTAVGKLIGYDGHFDFANIGDSYIENRVPHVLLRSVPAAFGAFCVPLVYLIMRESGYNYLTCMFTTIMYLFGNVPYLMTGIVNGMYLANNLNILKIMALLDSPD